RRCAAAGRQAEGTRRPRTAPRLTEHAPLAKDGRHADVRLERMKGVILTGAGISAESGVPTFRDADGLWEGHRVEDVASPEAFDLDPDRVHRFYDARRAALAAVEPNAAHRALAALETRIGADLLVVTQN